METIYHAKVAGHTVKIVTTGPNKYFPARVFAYSATGKGWSKGCLLTAKLGDVVRSMRRAVVEDHPRAEWHVILDITDKY